MTKFYASISIESDEVEVTQIAMELAQTIFIEDATIKSISVEEEGE